MIQIVLNTDKGITREFQRDCSILEQFTMKLNIKYDSKLQLTC